MVSRRQIHRVPYVPYGIDVRPDVRHPRILAYPTSYLSVFVTEQFHASVVIHLRMSLT